MKIENQVVSLELAKKLKELGVKQYSLWTWVLEYKKEILAGEYKLVIIGNTGFTNYVCAGRDNKEAGEMYAAFTVAELGEMLPSMIVKENNYYYLQLSKTPLEDFEVLYEQVSGEILGGDPADGRNSGNNKTKSKTEANARAKMLIYLIENKLLKK